MSFNANTSNCDTINTNEHSNFGPDAQKLDQNSTTLLIENVFKTDLKKILAENFDEIKKKEETLTQATHLIESLKNELSTCQEELENTKNELNKLKKDFKKHDNNNSKSNKQSQDLHVLLKKDQKFKDFNSKLLEILDVSETVNIEPQSILIKKVTELKEKYQLVEASNKQLMMDLSKCKEQIKNKDIEGSKYKTLKENEKQAFEKLKQEVEKLKKELKNEKEKNDTYIKETTHLAAQTVKVLERSLQDKFYSHILFDNSMKNFSTKEKSSHNSSKKLSRKSSNPQLQMNKTVPIRQRISKNINLNLSATSDSIIEDCEISLGGLRQDMLNDYISEALSDEERLIQWFESALNTMNDYIVKYKEQCDNTVSSIKPELDKYTGLCSTLEQKLEKATAQNVVLSAVVNEYRMIITSMNNANKEEKILHQRELSSVHNQYEFLKKEFNFLVDFYCKDMNITEKKIMKNFQSIYSKFCLIKNELTELQVAYTNVEIEKQSIYQSIEEEKQLLLQVFELKENKYENQKDNPEKCISYLNEIKKFLQLKFSINQVGQENGLRSCIHRLEEITTQIHDLTCQLKECEEALKLKSENYEELEIKFFQTNEDRKTYKTKIVELEQLTNTSDEELNRVRLEKEDLLKKLKKLQERYSELKTNKNSLVAQQKNKENHFRTQFEQIKSDCLVCDSQIKQYKTDLNCLKEKIIKKRNKINLLKSSVVSLNNQIVEDKYSIEKHKIERDTIEQKYKQCEMFYSELNLKFNDFLYETNHSANKMDQKKKKEILIHNQINELRLQNYKLECEIEAKSNDIKQLLSKIDYYKTVFISKNEDYNKLRLINNELKYPIKNIKIRDDVEVEMMKKVMDIEKEFHQPEIKGLGGSNKKKIFQSNDKENCSQNSASLKLFKQNSGNNLLRRSLNGNSKIIDQEVTPRNLKPISSVDPCSSIDKILQKFEKKEINLKLANKNMILFIEYIYLYIDFLNACKQSYDCGPSDYKIIHDKLKEFEKNNLGSILNGAENMKMQYEKIIKGLNKLQQNFSTKSTTSELQPYLNKIAKTLLNKFILNNEQTASLETAREKLQSSKNQEDIKKLKDEILNILKASSGKKKMDLTLEILKNLKNISLNEVLQLQQLAKKYNIDLEALKLSSTDRHFPIENKNSMYIHAVVEMLNANTNKFQFIINVLNDEYSGTKTSGIVYENQNYFQTLKKSVEMLIENEPTFEFTLDLSQLRTHCQGDTHDQKSIHKADQSVQFNSDVIIPSEIFSELEKALQAVDAYTVQTQFRTDLSKVESLDDPKLLNGVLFESVTNFKNNFITEIEKMAKVKTVKSSSNCHYYLMRSLLSAQEKTQNTLIALRSAFKFLDIGHVYTINKFKSNHDFMKKRMELQNAFLENQIIEFSSKFLEDHIILSPYYDLKFISNTKNVESINYEKISSELSKVTKKSALEVYEKEKHDKNLNTQIYEMVRELGGLRIAVNHLRYIFHKYKGQ